MVDLRIYAGQAEFVSRVDERPAKVARSAVRREGCSNESNMDFYFSSDNHRRNGPFAP
jgi:hypothetical protein